jgi:PBP1b-binding outer membrane lipoprotein LpoB
MKKIMLVVGLGLFLAGCNETQVVTSYKHLVVHPDEAMYYCPVLKSFPNWNTLTDSQVAKTVVQLYKNNLTCKSSIESIRKFLNNADKNKGSD